MLSESVSLPLNTVAMTLLFILFITLPIPCEGSYVPPPPFSLSSLPKLLLQLVDMIEVIQLLSLERRTCSCVL